MSESAEPHSLEQVVDRIDDAGGGGDRVAMRDVLEEFGQRSFGPLMLVPALVVVSPVGGIPGLPTVAAVLIALVAVQLLVGRDSIWLPAVLLRRTTKRDRLETVVGFAKEVAARVDAVIAPRLTVLVQSPFDRIIAILILALCSVMPPLEAVPFGNAATGAAISAFALALIARDGALVILAGAIMLAVGWFLTYVLPI